MRRALFAHTGANINVWGDGDCIALQIAVFSGISEVLRALYLTGPDILFIIFGGSQHAKKNGLEFYKEDNGLDFGQEIHHRAVSEKDHQVFEDMTGFI